MRYFLQQDAQTGGYSKAAAIVGTAQAIQSRVAFCGRCNNRAFRGQQACTGPVCTSHRSSSWLSSPAQTGEALVALSDMPAGQTGISSAGTGSFFRSSWLAHRTEAPAISFDFRLLPALLMQIKAHPRKAD
jgi:hypothetical protein